MQRESVLREEGMKVLIQKFGPVEAERFITTISEHS